MFAAIGRFSYRFRWLVIALWIVGFVLGLVAVPRLHHELKGGGFSNANAPAQRALDLMQRRLHTGLASIAIVFTSPSLDARSPQFQAAEAQALAGVTPATVPGLQKVQTYGSTGDARLISSDHKASLATLIFGTQVEQAQQQVDRIKSRLRPSGLTAAITGDPAVYQALETVSASDLRRAETYALPFALVVLVLVFGSVVAAALPVIGGGLAVTVTLGVLYLLAQRFSLSIFTMNVASLLGLAVGIDYSLFIVGRFREELAHGASVAAAVESTVAHAGRAIFFSGIAVMVGLSGLLMFSYMSLRSIGVGGAIVVAFSVLSALTLLPAVLGLLGRRVDSLRIMGHPGAESRFWRAWANWVMDHPVVVLIGTIVVIAVFAGPILRIRTNVPTATSLPTSQEARRGYDIVQARFDRGALNPIQVLITWQGTGAAAEATAPRNLAALYGYGRQLAALPGVESVTSIVNQSGLTSAEKALAFWSSARSSASLPPGASVPSPEARNAAASALLAATTAPGTVLFQVAPRSDPSGGAAQALSQTIRNLPPPAGYTAHVAGLSAGTRDFLSALYGRFPWVILFVVCVTYVVLLLLLRSAWLPLKAVLVNSLSIMASFGALVFVFQQGHLSGVLNFVPEGYVDATLPIIMFCTLFGVSMDYEVFLLTRMREAWLETGDNRQAVGFGLERTGRIITSAALIIVIVAGSFATTSILITKAIGVGLAVAIALDATIIRILLVPATMRLVGSINWWLPSSLERILPKTGEG
ncbi:MAG TPA: MMPL family transporter [Thermoleophilia bacterium]|nr:MMPL family transporter [Thermoleophilia bacterium]